MDLRKILLSATCLGWFVFNAGAGEKPQPIAFTLDGARLIKTLHEKEKLPVFSNNGVRGTGLTLSFAGRLGAPVLEVSGLKIDKVTLEDGSALPANQIRSDFQKTSHWGITLADDKTLVGIRVDLACLKLMNFQAISGSFYTKRPAGIKLLRSGPMKDEKGNKDATLGCEVLDRMSWGLGRYLRVKVGNADKLTQVRVLDADGKELHQSEVFNPISDSEVKLYIDMKDAAAFSLELSVAENMEEINVPFTIAPVKVLE